MPIATLRRVVFSSDRAKRSSAARSDARPVADQRDAITMPHQAERRVHDTNKAGLITPLVAEARRAGAMAYVREGTTRWAAAHVSDVAKLYVLALELGEPGGRYHASAEEGVAARTIPEAIGQGTGLPVRSVGDDDIEHYFGWMAPFAALDMTASSTWTQARLGWKPTDPDLLSDLAEMDYSVPVAV